MNDCVFCKIIAGEIPSKKIYEDDDVFVFQDIAPKASFHALAVPKSHISAVSEINGENSAAISHIFEVIARIATQEGISDYRVVTNCGTGAGQTVFHLHFHILGCAPGDALGEMC